MKPLKIQRAMFRDENRELTQAEYKRLVHAAETAGKCRTIFLPGKLRRLLSKYLKETCKTEGAVFTTRNRKPLDRSNIKIFAQSAF